MNNFTQIAHRYEISFQNFSIKNDTITSNLIAKSLNDDAAQKILNLMKVFAKAGQQSNFALEPILSISGDRLTRMTSVTFKIVPPNTATENTATGTTSQNPSN